MNISKFLVDDLESEEYAYRMLVYPNITFSKDLERDSYVVVLRNIIKYLNSRFKIHFTILSPSVIQSLQFPNVEQVIYPLPPEPNRMRTHFDASRFFNILNPYENDFDIIYSHLPEHTLQISNIAHNSTNMSPNIVGYCHWYEVAQNTDKDHTMILSNLFGTLEMQECGINSQWLKQLVLEESEQYLAKPLIKQLEKILQPHYLGVDVITPPTTKIRNSVIFNHRNSQYTGWSWFVDAMDTLWTERQDFTVYTTLVHIDRPWNKHVDLTIRSEYLSFLSKMQFGVGCFEKYSAWSISVTDGLSCGVPYLLPEKLCYPEMVPPQYPYFYTGKSEFIQKFNSMLDTPPNVNTMSDDMLWNDKISQWFGGWKSVFDLPILQEDTETFQKVISFIKMRKFATKRQIIDMLNWGPQLKWSKYRNRLRQVPEIKFTKLGYEWR